MIKELKIDEAQQVAPMQFNTLTLEKNSVLVARIPQNGFYDCEMMQALYKALKDRFPMHQILVLYDDVEFMANEAVVRNLPVSACYPADDELETLDFRAKGEIDGKVR